MAHPSAVFPYDPTKPLYTKDGEEYWVIESMTPSKTKGFFNVQWSNGETTKEPKEYVKDTCVYADMMKQLSKKKKKKHLRKKRLQRRAHTVSTHVEADSPCFLTEVRSIIQESWTIQCDYSNTSSRLDLLLQKKQECKQYDGLPEFIKRDLDDVILAVTTVIVKQLSRELQPLREEPCTNLDEVQKLHDIVRDINNRRSYTMSRFYTGEIAPNEKLATESNRLHTRLDDIIAYVASQIAQCELKHQLSTEALERFKLKLNVLDPEKSPRVLLGEIEGLQKELNVLKSMSDSNSESHVSDLQKTLTGWKVDTQQHLLKQLVESLTDLGYPPHIQTNVQRRRIDIDSDSDSDSDTEIQETSVSDSEEDS